MPLGTFCSGDLITEASRGGEYDTCDVIYLYKEMLREYALEFADRAETREPSKYELKMVERVTAYERGYIAKVKYF